MICCSGLPCSTGTPAWLQVYPTLVIRGTGLYELWKKGLYRNYEPTQLIDLVARILALVPPWVRVYRIQVSNLTLAFWPLADLFAAQHDLLFTLKTRGHMQRILHAC